MWADMSLLVQNFENAVFSSVKGASVVGGHAHFACARTSNVSDSSRTEGLKKVKARPSARVSTSRDSEETSTSHTQAARRNGHARSGSRDSTTKAVI